MKIKLKHMRTLMMIGIAFMLITPIAKAVAPETLVGLNLDYDKKQLTILVVSSGCTQAKDFKFELTSDTLTIIRTKHDACKAMPEVVSFTYPFKEIGINPNQPLIIANPFIANPNLANMGVLISL